MRAFEDARSLEGAAGRPLAEVLLYTPALDADRGVDTEVCRRWPGAALYTLLDRTGRTRLLAARPAGPGWEPPWEGGRWSVHRCGSGRGA